MLKQANDPITNAYAKGYLSHVAGDICGHPFINAIVEGPFRNHAYRHIVLEGLADTWLWDKVGKGDIISAELHKQIDLSSADFFKISSLITNAMKATYKAPMLPSLFEGGYPTVGAIRGAYERMHLYLDLSTTGGASRPTPPPDDPQ